MSIRYAVDLQRSEKKSITSFDELIIFKKKQFCSPPTVICLIGRAADNLIQFQAVVKKRLSMFELLRCCRIFQPRSEKLCTLQGAAEFQEVVRPLTAIERIRALYYSTDYLCIRFLYKRLPLLVRC